MRITTRSLLSNAILALALALLNAFAASVAAQVPQIINYQSKISAGTAPFTGVGKFRFALVNGEGTITYWSNDGTSTEGSEPSAAVSLPVVGGLYSVPLGDTAIPGMLPVPASVFANGDVRLRVWFDDSTANGSQLLAPDQRITSVGYAMVAAKAVDSGFPPGGVISFAGTAAPEGWLLCDGSAVSRTTYAGLFAAIGTSHGAGDGTTTFNLPDYRGRFLRGADDNSGNDPDAATRTPMAAGGVATGVGSLQVQSTAKNGLLLNDAGHAHVFQDWSNATSWSIDTSFLRNPLFDSFFYIAADINTGNFVYRAELSLRANNYNYQTYNGTAVSGAGVSLDSTDTETRPVNVAVKYLIKY